MPDNLVKPPRFPYVAALLCAACLCAAAWTWVRYSYCWDLTQMDLLRGRSQADLGGESEGQYVRIHGIAEHTYAHRGAPVLLTLYDPVKENEWVFATVPWSAAPANRSRVTLIGRVVWGERPLGVEGVPVIHTTRTRFHGASIAGLVVGAMGVFVFAVALRHWLRERRGATGRATPEA